MSVNQIVAEVEAAKKGRRTANESSNMTPNDMSASPGAAKVTETKVVLPQHRVDEPVVLRVTNR